MSGHDDGWVAPMHLDFRTLSKHAATRSIWPPPAMGLACWPEVLDRTRRGDRRFAHAQRNSDHQLPCGPAQLGEATISQV